jgi:hypothetical protein
MSSNSEFKGEVDMTFKVGDLVGVPCAIQAGPFPDEKLVTVETSEGQISGFVKESSLQVDPGDPEHGRVTGAVVAATEESLTVKLFGSFFTTAQGVASVRRNNLTRIAA